MSPEEHPIPEFVAAKVAQIVGGNPFYLQVIGEALTSADGPYDETVLKGVLQQVLFSRTGRLSLYLENEHQRLVGRSTTLNATLNALATSGPLRLTALAHQINASTASTARYLERLGDAVSSDNGSYSLADQLFGLWLQWRSPGGTVVPMRLIGDEAELQVAQLLAALGFDLVYKSRASRGAFDLCAIRGATQLGVQVKRKELPLSFTKIEWNRMHADAQRWGWHWVVAAVDAQHRVTILDPAQAASKRRIQLDASAAIENLLAWLDTTPP